MINLDLKEYYNQINFQLEPKGKRFNNHHFLYLTITLLSFIASKNFVEYYQIYRWYYLILVSTDSFLIYNAFFILNKLLLNIS